MTTSPGDRTPTWATGARRLVTAPWRGFIPAVLVLAFVPAFSSAVVPAHDALQVFTAFWTYVSGLVTDGRLPEWIPNGGYGTPAGPILLYVTPVAFVTGAMGAVLHAAIGFNDTLTLFKLTVALEYVLFAAGLLRFSRLLIESTAVQHVVVALGILSSPWIVSLDGNFHAFYMTPWILACLTQGFQTGAPRHIGAAALLSVFACVGNVPYFPPFLLLQLTVFALPLMWGYPRHAKQLLVSPATWLWLAVAGAAFALHFVALVKGMDGLAILSPGRDPASNHVPREVFLTWAGVTTPIRFLREIVTGRITNGDNTFYMGLGSLVLAPMSLLLPKSPVLRSIQTLSLFLLLFSTGGIVASVSYYFPGMVYYRHVSIVFGLFRILMFVCVGCVLDQLVRNPTLLTDWRRWLPRRGHSLATEIVVVLIAVEMTRAHLRGPDYQLMLFGAPQSTPLLVARLIGYFGILAAGVRLRSRNAWPYLLMVGLLVDMGTFWGHGWVQWPRLTRSEAVTMRHLSTPRGINNLGARVRHADIPRLGNRLYFIQSTRPLNLGALYVHTYSLAGVDPCVSQLRTDFFTKSIADLFASRGRPLNFSPNAETEQAIVDDPWLARALACDSPRVTSDARIAGLNRGYNWIQLTIDNAEREAKPVTVSEASSPGWTVTVDDQPAALVVRNQAFLGADVPPGQHQIAFRFHVPLAGWLRTYEAVVAGLSALWLLGYAIRHLAQEVPVALI